MNREIAGQLRFPYLVAKDEISELRYEGKGLIATGIGTELVSPLAPILLKEWEALLPFVALGLLSFIGSYFKFRKAKRIENFLDQPTS